jgi:hypothetical protein
MSFKGGTVSEGLKNTVSVYKKAPDWSGIQLSEKYKENVNVLSDGFSLGSYTNFASSKRRSSPCIFQV